MIVLGAVCMLLVGSVFGALATNRSWTHRSVRFAEATAVATSDAADVQVDEVALALAQAADRLDLAIVVGDRAGGIAYRNAPAEAMRGTHVGAIVDEHVALALTAAAAGESVDKRIDLHGPPRVSLELRAERLTSGFAVTIVNDVSDRTRIEAMRTDFVANISHELKTPVGAIAVLAETLEDERDAEVVARVARRIVDESHRAVTTIDDLLELSRIESSRLNDDVIDVGEIVVQAVARGRDVDPGKNVEVTAFRRDSEIFLRADHRQIVSALGNLVENAVKYSDDGGIVQVRTRVDERHVEIMVTDQGVGIPQRDLDRIFERFYRVDRARSRETGGTGLGLAIVRHVASNHGGQVLVSSHEGEGSTFVLRLPASLLVDSGDDAAFGDDPPDAAVTPPPGGEPVSSATTAAGIRLEGSARE